MTATEKILVAGGAGFIGSNLVRRLVEDGHQVTVLDNFCTGRESNLKGIEVDIINRDIRTLFTPETEYVKPEATFDWQGDVIINLACPASPPRYQKDPVFTWETSVLGNLHLVEHAIRAKAYYIYASTSEVYGDPLKHPQSEEYNGNVNPIGPRACYDEGKRAAETLIMDSIRKRGLDAAVIRIFNTYGPHMDPADGRVVSNFICQALTGQTLTIYGEGLQTRSFCFVDDMVNAIAGLIAHKPQGGPFNVGNPREFTILDLAKLVREKVKDAAEIQHLPLPADDPRLRRPDISRIQKTIGWEPKVPLEEGLDRTIAYFHDEIKAHL